MKEVDYKKFREEGYLQEVNRLFFHPLGLVLTLDEFSSGNLYLGSVYEVSDESEDFIYDVKSSNNQDIINGFNNKINNIMMKREAMKKIRMEKFGFDIEPAVNVDDNDRSEAK